MIIKILNPKSDPTSKSMNKIQKIEKVYRLFFIFLGESIFFNQIFEGENISCLKDLAKKN